MKMTHWILLGVTLLGAACARVQVEAPKDPIKMDISMRLDVYQHIAKDVDAIEDIVRGKSETQSASLAEWLVGTAYAEDLSPAVREAALRRRARLSQIESFQRQGILGEGSTGLLVMRGSSSEAAALAGDENADRQFMFAELARSQGTSPDQVGRVFAKRLQSEAPAGTPVESESGAWGSK
jgi:uncharacterized protein YdbL (DUF1318 family)